MSMSGCREVGKLLFDYLEGNLDNRISASVESHLSVCETCRSELERCRAVLAILAEAKVTPPEGFAASVMLKTTDMNAGSDGAGESRNDNGKSAKILSPRRPSVFRYGTVAAAAVLVVAIAVGWRVLPAFMQKTDSAQFENNTPDDGSASIEYALDMAAENRTTAETAAGAGEETSESGDIMMFSLPARDETVYGETGGTITPENLMENENGSVETGEAESEPESEPEPAECETPSSISGKSMTKADLTTEELILAYAPGFADKANEVALFYTPSPIHDRPYATESVDGENYTAYLINGAELIAEAERLASELGGELYGEPGVGLVWIEIYN